MPAATTYPFPTHPSLTCPFVVQGEGRGHMTQALALARLLTDAGHHVAQVLVGRSARRRIPDFFLDRIGAPVATFESPNFTVDAAQRSVHLVPTLLHNARRLRRFRESLDLIEAHLDRHRPDVVLNFFEPLVGVLYALRRPRVPMVCIGHQYLFLHPDFSFPPGRWMDRWTLQRFTRLTALGSVRRLALSFYPAADRPERRLSVLPPLLREELFTRPDGLREPFLLVYLLNRGYADDLIRWHGRNPEVALHCFWDEPEAPATWAYDETLTFHRLDDRKFLDLMARCAGLVCTAGFESVCEAMYLGKPVLMVPVDGHFEQYCNALDAAAAGAGLRSDRFDLDRLLAWLPRYESPAPDFRRWLADAGARFVAEVERAARLHPAPAALAATAG